MKDIPDDLDSRQVLFTSLQLLGLEPAVMERNWRIPFNCEMFDLPNKKGFEAVMHFLFNRLNPIQCKEQFRYCWPVNDKKQEQQFRKVCNSWLVQIVECDAMSHLPRINASIFMSPGGDRFIELLCSFTRYVLQKVTFEENGQKQKDCLRYPLLSTQNIELAPVVEAAVQCGAIHKREHFLTTAQETVCVRNEWASYSSDLVKAYRGLSKRIRELELDVHAQINFAIERGKAKGSPVAHKKRRSGHVEYDYDLQGVKRSQKLHKVRQLWKAVEHFQHTCSPSREVLESVLQRDLDKYRIDAADLRVTVPDRLLRECEKEIQRRNVDNVFVGGKLNLLSVVHLWNLSLHLYLEALHEAGGVPALDDAVPAVTTQLHTHNAHLANTEALRTKLEKKIIPEIKESINELKQKLDHVMMRSQSPEAIRTTSIGLGLLPPTPPMTFDPRDLPHAQMSDPRGLTDGLRIPIDKASTPEAASKLIESINEKMQQLSRQQQGTLQKATKLAGPLPSRLPQREEKVETEVVGNKQRTKVKCAKAAMADQKVKPKPVPKESKRPIALRKNPQGQKVEPHHNVVASPNRPLPNFTKSPGSDHAQLADQLVEAMLGEDQEGDDAEDLALRLRHTVLKDDGDAFLSRSRLRHSPDVPTSSSQNPSASPSTQHMDKLNSSQKKRRSPGKTWHKSLLSSTRLEDASKHSVDPAAAAAEADPLVTKLFSPAESDFEEPPAVVTLEPGQPSPGKSTKQSPPKSPLYHPAVMERLAEQSPMSVHSGWSSPGTGKHPRSPHGTRSFLRSPPPGGNSTTTEASSSEASTPRLPDPRTSHLFSGTDNTSGSSSEHRTQANTSSQRSPHHTKQIPSSPHTPSGRQKQSHLERDLMQWSTLDKPTDYHHNSPRSLQQKTDSTPHHTSRSHSNILEHQNARGNLEWLMSDLPATSSLNVTPTKTSMHDSPSTRVSPKPALSKESFLQLLSSPSSSPKHDVGTHKKRTVAWDFEFGSSRPSDVGLGSPLRGLVDNDYGSLFECQTPQLPVRTRTRQTIADMGTPTEGKLLQNNVKGQERSNRNNSNTNGDDDHLDFLDSDNVENEEHSLRPPISLLTMTPAMGKMFAQTSAKIVATETSKEGFQPFDPRTFEEADGAHLIDEDNVITDDDTERDDNNLPSDEEDDRHQLTSTNYQANANRNNSLHEEEEESVRVIEFQNGKFNEFLDKSPVKDLQDLKDDELKSSVRLIQLEHETANKISTSSSSSDTDSIVERYRKLRTKSAAAATNKSSVPLKALSSSKPTSLGGRSPPQPSITLAPQQHRLYGNSPAPAASSSMNTDELRQRLQLIRAAAGLTAAAADTSQPATSNSPPTASVATTAARFSLDLGEDEENLPPALGIDDDDFADMEQVLIQVSPACGSPSNRKTPATGLETPSGGGSGSITRLSALPMSPMTDALHRDSPSTYRTEKRKSHSSGARKSLDRWSDLLGEDPSILIPSSPNDS